MARSAISGLSFPISSRNRTAKSIGPGYNKFTQSLRLQIANDGTFPSNLNGGATASLSSGTAETANADLRSDRRTAEKSGYQHGKKSAHPG